MEWPGYFRDLNPIENLWGCTARYMYKDERHLNSTEPKNAILILYFTE